MESEKSNPRDVPYGGIHKLSANVIYLIAFWGFLFATSGLAGAAESTTVTQHGITWTFDKPVQVGQFVDGDWWVLPPPGQESVTIKSVIPAPTRTKKGKMINGSTVNPKPACQGLDERADQWRSDQSAAYPLRLKPGESLISAMSQPEADDVAASKIARFQERVIKDVAILTCLDRPAKATDFRPAYVGTHKTIYSSLKLRRDLLPELPVVGTPPNIMDLTKARFSHAWVDYPLDWTGNQVRGVYESGYGREKTVDVGGAALVLCLDHKVVGDKELLLIGLVQTGIDLYGTLMAGGRWPANGGHMMGRKFPILFAGLMLGDEGMLEIGKKYPPESNTFQEDAMAFIVTKKDVGRKLDCTVGGKAMAAGRDSIGIAGKTPTEPNGLPGLVILKYNRIKITDGPGAGQIRMIAEADNKWAAAPPPIVTCKVTPNWDVVPIIGQSVYQVLGYREEDIGRAQIGASPHAVAPWADNPSDCTGYPVMNKMCWPGQVLASRILGLKDVWHHDAVFQVIDEYVAATAPAGFYHDKVYPRFWSSGSNDDDTKYSVKSSFINAMWDAYRPKADEFGAECMEKRLHSKQVVNSASQDLRCGH